MILPQRGDAKKVDLLVYSQIGVVALGNGEQRVCIQVVDQKTLDEIRSGRSMDHMVAHKKCDAFQKEFVALLDRFEIDHFATEVLT